MSGIAGIARRYPSGVALETLGSMAAAIRHRGPDEYGFYATPSVGFAHVRLSVVDPSGGAQPMTNEDGEIVVTYNGEVYNHRELRLELEHRGHVFRTRCDTEVLVHAYEEWGADLLQRLNGEFAFAIHDRRRGVVFVARDRFGIRPLFYAQRNGDFYFGSEIKAILATGEVEAAVDFRGIEETLTFGAARLSRTAFSGIASLEPGTYGLWKDGALWLRHFYELDYPEAEEEPVGAVEQLDEIMLRSVGMRLRADVPVGAHLSGGFNSSVAASLAASASEGTLRTFSIDIRDPQSAGSSRPRQVADAIGSEHLSASVGQDSIAESFPEVLWHAETPMLTTAPVAMYHLARLTREAHSKVVLRGEGADELFLGSEVFREASVRRFCLRQPQSVARQQLFARVFPQLAAQGTVRGFWSRTFLQNADPRDPIFSHLPRFLAARARDFYTDDFAATLGGVDVIGELRASLPTRFFAWSPLNQAAYIETTTKLSPHALSLCGDRMTMAHGVETRFPFLDHRLFEFASALPTRSRLAGLQGKEILRRWATRIMQPGVKLDSSTFGEVTGSKPFSLRNAPAWMEEHLSPEALKRVGIFAPEEVTPLVQRLRSGLVTDFVRNSPFVGILSTQLWHSRFIQASHAWPSLPLGQASVVLRESASDQSERLVARGNFVD